VLLCIYFNTGDTFRAYNVQRTAAIRQVRLTQHACSDKRGRIELYAVEKVAACEALGTVNNIDHMIWVIAYGFFVFYGGRGGGVGVAN
jgi:hypothetical protein